LLPAAIACLLLSLGFAHSASALLISEFGAQGAPGEDGESVEVSGTLISVGADPAELIGVGFGGRGGPAPVGGGPAGDGGGSGIDSLHAASDSGDVTVRGSAIGGAGGLGTQGDPGGSGASVLLRNGVDGDTAGELELFQGATGGSAGVGIGGEAGRAVSWLQRSKSAESFELTSRAMGGGAPRAPRGAVGRIDGAPALSTAHAVNDAGSLRVVSAARGGEAGSSFTDGAGAGGDASAFAFARSEGDGHPVFVSIPPPLTDPGPGGGPGYELPLRDTLDQDYSDVLGCGLARGCTGFEERGPVAEPLPAGLDPGPFFAGALGGVGGGFLSTSLPSSSPPAGNGGKARSVSIGIAAGNSPVEVFDVAEGGRGGFQVGVAEGGPSEGGAARSVALGVGAGTSPVKATAQATGGASGSVAGSLALPEDASFFPPEDGLPGGRGDASAVAIGRGEALAEAVSTGGLGTAGVAAAAGPRHPGSVGRALAKAIGTHGTATARARSSSGKLQVQASAESSLLEAATVEARIGPPRRGSFWQRLFRRLDRQRGAREAFAEATVAPDAREVEHALRGQPELSRALEDAGVDTVDALGSFSARQRREAPPPRGPASPRGSPLLRSVFELELSDVVGGLGGATDPTYIGFFAPRLSRRGFVALHVTLENGDDLLLDEIMFESDAAESFLDGTLLEVGFILGARGNPWPVTGLSGDRATLRVALATSIAGGGLAFDFLVGTAPPDDSQQPSPPIDWSPEP
jgi:hypothetical protein